MHSITKKVSLSLTSILFAFNLAACGGDEGDSLKNDSRKVSSLKPAELTEVCKEGRDLVTEDQKKAAAKVGCTIANVLAEECTPAAVEACVTEILKQPESPNCDLDLDAAKCDVTVGQLITCELDTIAAIAGAAKNLTCENALTGGLPQQEPGSCKIVKDKCPSAFEN